MRLNEQQEIVAEHVGGRILTLAGPGSGKTRTLTERTGRLIRKGIQPAHILCLTFTNKARDEMRHRVAAVHGQAAQQVFISNFHGLCGTILRKLGGPLGYSDRMTIIDSDDQVDLMLQIARKKGIEASKPAAWMMALAVNEWRENLGDEGQLAAVFEERFSSRELSVAKTYVELLRGRNQCDFSGLLYETVRLLREQPEARERLQKRFQFIQVDEFQDTNKAQNEIVELLAGPADNVLAVGDGDQSIYEWRGASPEGIPRFIRNGEAKTGSCKIVKLGMNYRSTPQIIETADRLIRHCAGRIEVEFSTTNAPGELPRCASIPTPEEEAEAVAESIRNTLRQSYVAREIAVFYRTNDMSRLVEQSLAKRQIPYQVIGGGSYYERMEVKDVLSMLRFVCNPADGIAFARIANKPARGMGPALIGKLETFAEQHGCHLLTAMSEQALEHVKDENGKGLGEAAVKACRETRAVFDVPLAGQGVGMITHELLSRSRYDEWLKERYDEKGEYEQRRQNVFELTNSIAEFSRQAPRATVADYLQSISLYTDSDKEQQESSVRLMSLHSSKGLEFDVVYMIGVEHGILPHAKAVEDRGERGLDEERRLCYVGFTRAKKILRVTWCQRRQDTSGRDRTGRFKASRPSRFLLESGLLTREQFDEAVKASRMPMPRR